MGLKSENDDLLASTLVESYSMMFEEAIKIIPETHWKNGEIEYLTPARLIFHTIEATDYYTPDSPTGYIWNKRFDIDPDAGEIPVERLPSKQSMLEYHDEVREKVEDWLNSLNMKDILRSEEKFPWTGSTLLGRIMYILAHNKQHFGELNAELRRRDLPRIKWRTKKS